MGASSNLTAWERWELASFGEERREHPLRPAPPPEPQPPQGTDAGAEVAEVRLPTAEELEQIHQQARDEGFRRGREEGYQAGYQAGFEEGRAKSFAEAQRLATAVEKLETYLGGLDQHIAEETLALAVALAREVVRQELSAKPEALLAVVREALTHLPHQHAAIYLNPEDASLLRSYLGDQLAHAGHRIHEDASLARGDCLLEAGGSQVDATVATRWQRVLANLGIASAWQGEPILPTSSCPAGEKNVA